MGLLLTILTDPERTPAGEAMRYQFSLETADGRVIEAKGGFRSVEDTRRAGREAVERQH